MGEKQALYFGSLGHGHFLYNRDGQRDCGGVPEWAPGFPWESAAWLDGSILKNRKVVDQPDGRVHVTGGGREHFWFAFVWWDRSADSRGASNSGFYVRGFGAPVRETYDAIAKIAFEYACAQWPEVVARQKFPLTLAPAQATDPTTPGTGAVTSGEAAKDGPSYCHPRCGRGANSAWQGVDGEEWCSPACKASGAPVNPVSRAAAESTDAAQSDAIKAAVASERERERKRCADWFDTWLADRCSLSEARDGVGSGADAPGAGK